MSDIDPQLFTRRAFKRRAFMKNDGRGNSTAEWTLTATSLTDPVQIIAEPVETLPIIFVPGIMGSNVKLTGDIDGKEKNKAVWLMNSKAGAARDWSLTDAASRQKRLNPATTDVFSGGEPHRVLRRLVGLSQTGVV